MKQVTFQTDKLHFTATFNQSKTAQAILRTLPIQAEVNRWGDEIYFEIPVKLPPENPTLEVKVGDIAYWPEGHCLCIFFGRTPASKGSEPRPASSVSIVGHTDERPDSLRLIREGSPISVRTE